MDKMMKTVIRKKTGQLYRSPASIHNNRNLAAGRLVDNRSATAAQRQLMEGIDNSPQSIAQRQAQALINDSSVMSLQRQQFETSLGLPVQKLEAVEDEELLQGRFEAVQRQQDLEEEELLQGKFETAQRMGPEDEELLQGKFDTIQRVEEDELLQGKFETAQRTAPEEEELMQGKFDMIQRIEEEELLQGKFETIQNKTDNTGLPDNLKAGIENLSGMDMSAVRVHTNSSRPAQLNALAYAQGNDIHLGSGQEQHLPHEAWHVVQQRQGRVKPTIQMEGQQINNDAGLETEADVMGEKALQYKKF